MDPLSEIREKIKRIANITGSFTCFTAKVVSVDGETCDVELEGMKLTDVRLRAVVNLITPTKKRHSSTMTEKDLFIQTIKRSISFILIIK